MNKSSRNFWMACGGPVRLMPSYVVNTGSCELVNKLRAASCNLACCGTHVAQALCLCGFCNRGWVATACDRENHTGRVPVLPNRLIRLLRFIDVHVFGVDHFAFRCRGRSALRCARSCVGRATACTRLRPA